MIQTPTTVQVELDPEYLKWPSACVCCGRPDERDMEMAVPSTDTDEHETDVIMEVKLPYCLACYTHTTMRVAWARVVVVLVVVSMVAITVDSVFTMDALPGRFTFLMGSGIFGLSLAACTLFIAWEFFQIRRSMLLSCSAPRNQVVFSHPTSSHMSTVTFTNVGVARDFSDLNRYHLVRL